MAKGIINNNGEGRHPRAMGARLRTWRPELPDHRDLVFRPSGAVLRDRVAPLGIERGVRIHDQGQTSSCTGHAATSCVETTLGLKGDSLQLSRLFPYYFAREMIGETHLDMGAYNRDVMKSFAHYGCPKESSWRYVASKITTRPTLTAMRRAEESKTGLLANLSYERCVSLEMMLHAINDGHAVLFGFMAYNTVFHLNARDYVYKMPTDADYPMGGHAVVADGFDIPNRLLEVQNSWGTGWGKRGRFQMPFDWISDPRRLADDFWIVRVPSV